jgi:hypothetical protein
VAHVTSLPYEPSQECALPLVLTNNESLLTGKQQTTARCSRPTTRTQVLQREFLSCARRILATQPQHGQQSRTLITCLSHSFRSSLVLLRFPFACAMTFPIICFRHPRLTGREAVKLKRRKTRLHTSAGAVSNIALTAAHCFCHEDTHGFCSIVLKSSDF